MCGAASLFACSSTNRGRDVDGYRTSVRRWSQCERTDVSHQESVDRRTSTFAQSDTRGDGGQTPKIQVLGDYKGTASWEGKVGLRDQGGPSVNNGWRLGLGPKAD